MWIERRRHALQRHPAIGLGAVVVLLLVATLLKLAMPSLPTLSLFFPPVLIGAFLGGRATGLLSLIGGALITAYFVYNPPPPLSFHWQTVSIVVFIAVGGLIIFVLKVLDDAILRLHREQSKLELVLKSAHAAIWEFNGTDAVKWNKNFVDLLGLPPGSAPPDRAQFLDMVHPQDRPKLEEAYRLITLGMPPAPHDDFRIRRSDGTWVWFDNHRVCLQSSPPSYMGLVIDITERKNSEEQISFLLQELAHRSKNQFAVISTIAKDVYQQAGSGEDFHREFQLRMTGLARSQDLVVLGGAQSTSLLALLQSQAGIFGAEGRIATSGPVILVAETAAQYLAIAFYELITNSIKYGALATENRKISLAWKVNGGGAHITLQWREPMDTRSTSAKTNSAQPGFGTKVLNTLTAQALGGTARFLKSGTCIEWTLVAPLGESLRLASPEEQAGYATVDGKNIRIGDEP
ncbi:MAG: HWE histidine kinase domain-containing protein [Hyphomicrobiales bacterium]